MSLLMEDRLRACIEDMAKREALRAVDLKDAGAEQLVALIMDGAWRDWVPPKYEDLFPLVSP